MEFKKYQHVCRLGTSDTDGILNGKCYIFPKIDGTNSQVYLDDTGTLCAGSRNHKLSLEKDNQAFYKTILDDKQIAAYLHKHPNHRLFGEWLVPHSLKTYVDDAWKKFYIFDVCIDNGDDFKYLTYEEYAPLLDEFNLLYLKPLMIEEDPTQEQIAWCVNNNTYNIKENEGCGEGIVIKRYDYINKYGRIVWAKVLHDEFNNKRQSKGKKDTIVGKLEIEFNIVDNYVTSDFIEKEYAKIINDYPPIQRKKLIPILIERVWKTLIDEEMYNIIKKYKCPIVDFKGLKKLVIDKIKKVKIDLFK